MDHFDKEQCEPAVGSSANLATGPTEQADPQPDHNSSTTKGARTKTEHLDSPVQDTAEDDTATEPKPSVKKDSDSEGSDIPELENLSFQNADYRPFRDEESLHHINSHLHRGPRARNTESISSTASSAGLDKQAVRAKVKGQLQKQQRRQFARRVRKSGEAAVVTKARRATADAIKQSAVWDY